MQHEVVRHQVDAKNSTIRWRNSALSFLSYFFQIHRRASDSDFECGSTSKDPTSRGRYATQMRSTKINHTAPELHHSYHQVTGKQWRRLSQRKCRVGNPCIISSQTTFSWSPVFYRSSRIEMEDCIDSHFNASCGIAVAACLRKKIIRKCRLLSLLMVTWVTYRVSRDDWCQSWNRSECTH